MPTRRWIARPAAPTAGDARIIDGAPNGIAAITPERVIREGDPMDQIADVIDNDADIAMLVLAASTGPEGPGPLISAIARTAGRFAIPVTIVPGNLTDDEIDTLS